MQDIEQRTLVGHLRVADELNYLIYSKYLLESQWLLGVLVEV